MLRRSLQKLTYYPRIIAVASFSATFFNYPSKSLGESTFSTTTTSEFCDWRQNDPFSRQSIDSTTTTPILRRTMSGGNDGGGGGGNSKSALIGALRKAGIEKPPNEVTNDEWARILTPAQFEILRQAGTERAFSGEYVDTKEVGSYHCAACGTLLFRSEAKFDSHCGWPSFYASAKPSSTGVDAKDAPDGSDGSKVARRIDSAHGMQRTEIYCKSCNSHLGHVFEDGPQPTGERHCVNSASIEFIASAVDKKK